MSSSWKQASELAPRMFDIDSSLSRESANWNHNLANVFKISARLARRPERLAAWAAASFDAADWRERGRAPLAEMASVDADLAQEVADALAKL